MTIGSIDSLPKSALATRSVPAGAACWVGAAAAVAGAAVAAAAVVGFAAGAAAGAVVGAAAGALVGAAGAGALVAAGGVAAGPQAARIDRLAAPMTARRNTVRRLHNCG